MERDPIAAGRLAQIEYGNPNGKGYLAEDGYWYWPEGDGLDAPRNVSEG